MEVPTQQPAGEKLKVLRLRKQNEGRFLHTITREHFLHAMELQRQRAQINKACEDYMAILEQAWRTGALVEDCEFSIEEIVRRGGGAYIERWEKPGVRIARRKWKAG